MIKKLKCFVFGHLWTVDDNFWKLMTREQFSSQMFGKCSHCGKKCKKLLNDGGSLNK